MSSSCSPWGAWGGTFPPRRARKRPRKVASVLSVRLWAQALSFLSAGKGRSPLPQAAPEEYSCLAGAAGRLLRPHSAPAPTSPPPQGPRRRPGCRYLPGRDQRGAGSRRGGFVPRENKTRGSPARQPEALVPPEHQETSDRKFVRCCLGWL